MSGARRVELVNAPSGPPWVSLLNHSQLVLSDSWLQKTETVNGVRPLHDI